MIAEIHEQLLSKCKPGFTLSRLHQISTELLTDALLDLGVKMDSSNKSEIVRKRLYFPFYSHAVGHWLGIDVHDCPSVASTNPLVAGVILTIEPGLYFQVNGAPISDVEYLPPFSILLLSLGVSLVRPELAILYVFTIYCLSMFCFALR